MATKKTQDKKEITLPYTMQLKHPFNYGKESQELIKELVIRRRPKAKDLKGINMGDQGKGVEMLFPIMSRLTGEDVTIIEELDLEDLFELAQVVTDFLPDFLQTGPQNLG